MRVSIAGASGYAGGELLRLLLGHPGVAIGQVTSERYAGRSVAKVHPNLRRVTDLTFSATSELEPCDVLLLGLPHGESSRRFAELEPLAPRIVDLSADFRLDDPASYEEWYGRPHARPDLLERFVYGIPELHREEMRGATYVSSAGCNATATILALAPLFRRGLASGGPVVAEVKVGSSEAGNAPSEGSHHPERSGCVRSFRPTRHRHTAEVLQELGLPARAFHFSATAIDMVRGVLATCHVFLPDGVAEKDVWKAYREAYGDEPFLRIVKDRDGTYRYPEPKLLWGTNFCDVGFELDPATGRLVVIAAIDNLMKGAAGQAVQALNLMCGFEETTALGFPGLHPV